MAAIGCQNYLCKDQKYTAVLGMMPIPRTSQLESIFRFGSKSLTGGWVTFSIEFNWLAPTLFGDPYYYL